MTAQEIANAEQDAQAKCHKMIEVLGEQIPQKQRDYLAKVAANWPERRQNRILHGQGVTLVHRDPHLYNFLYPRQEEGASKIIDWQSWRVDTGTDDLAYMMACHWDESQRNDLEIDLLQRYHTRLLERGIAHYSWGDCWYDYRASIIRCIFFLVNAWTPHQWEYKWKRIERGLTAFQQYDCLELLS